MLVASYVEADRIFIMLSGRFTFDDHTVFEEVLTHVRQASDLGIYLDMKAIQFIDSAGLGMLLLAHDEAKKQGKKIIISGLNGQAKKMFYMTRMERLFEVA